VKTPLICTPGELVEIDYAERLRKREKESNAKMISLEKEKLSSK
jgi:hypothetical protein